MVWRPGDQGGGAGVHQRELALGVGAGARALADPDIPCVTDQAIGAVQTGLVDDVALVLRGSANDELDHAVVLRCAADVLEPGVEIPGSQIGHALMMQRTGGLVPTVVRHTTSDAAWSSSLSLTRVR